MKGAVAIEDELIGKGLIRPGPKRWVKVTQVHLLGVPPSEPRLLPHLRFVVSEEDQAQLHSFAIEQAAAVDALQLAHPSNTEPPVPAPAFIYEDAGEGLVHRGRDLFLTVSTVRLESQPRGHIGPPGNGVRFAICDSEDTQIYSFTMDWSLAFLVIIAAYPEHLGPAS